MLLNGFFRKIKNPLYIAITEAFLGCGGKTRTCDLRVMRVLSAIFEFY